VAPVLHSTNSFLRNSACVASLLLITILGIGCVGDIQKKTIPGLSLSASSFNFQTVIVGQKATQTFQISNTGTAAVRISAPSVSNPEFSITGPSIPLTVNGSSALLTLLPARSISYTLTFAPTTPGSATATVNLATSAASQPVSISLSGNAEKAFANLQVTPTVVSFGNLALKSTSTQNVTLENTGDISVALQGVNVSGAGFGYAGLSPGYSLAPNQKVTFQVWFSPKVAGPASATLSLLSPNISSPETLSLSGNGVSSTTPSPTPTPAPAVAKLLVTPTVVSFGNLALKSTSTQNVTLENTGDISVALQGVTLSGAGFGYADLSPGYSLAPNQKVTFQVWFSPKVAGPASATLSLLSPNISSPGTLSMYGNGVSTTTPPPAAPPTPPPAAQHTVALTWNASTSQVIGYRVFRSETSGGSYNSLNGTAVNALAYTDSTVASGTTYYYVVTAVDSAGVESVYSNQVVAVVPAS